ncbi:MAG: DoxX family protein [Ignavibacteriales bacterium]|nr:DoxX family protein [Ignavibacteriales bacterium]
MKWLTGLTRFNDTGLLCLRLAIGSIFLVHGTAKWSMWGMEPSEQLPAAMLTIMKILSVAEPLGAVAVVLGFLTPLAAVGLSIVMLGAINMKIFAMGLKFMEMQSTGWEFDFLIFCALVCVLTSGPGKYSVDMRMRKGETAPVV